MIHPVLTRAESAGTSTALRMTCPFAPVGWSGTENVVHMKMPAPCTIRRLKVVREVPPGAGCIVTYTMRKAGSPTALTFTISGTNLSGQNEVDEVDYDFGDSCTLSSDADIAPADSEIHISFEVEAEGQIHGVALPQHGTGGRWHNLIGYPDISLWDAGLIPADRGNTLWGPAGRIVSVYFTLRFPVGDAGDAWQCRLYKNEVAQDGGGGTTDTTFQIDDPATDGDWQGELTVARGDRLSFWIDDINTPISNSGSLSWMFIPDVVGAFQLAVSSETGLSTTLDRFGAPSKASNTWSGTETVVRVRAGLTPFLISGITIRASAANDGRVFNVRKNGADLGPNATMAGGLVTAEGGSPTDIVLFQENDWLSIRTAGNGGVFAIWALHGSTGDADPPPEEPPDEPEGGGETEPDEPDPDEDPLPINPKIFVLIQLPNGDEYAIGETDLADDADWYAGMKPGVLSQEVEIDVYRELADDSYRTTNWRFRLIDLQPLRRWRTLALTTEIEGAVATAYAVDDDVRFAKGRPWVIGRGEVVHHTPVDGMRYDFEVADILGRRFQQWGTRAKVPWFKATTDWLGGLDPAFDGKTVPLLLGKMINGRGMVPLIFLGTLNLNQLPGNSAGPNKVVDVYLICIGASPLINDAFISPASWKASETVFVGLQIRPASAPNGHYYVCTTAGTTGTTEPAFPTGTGATVADGSAVWTEAGADTIRIEVPDEVWGVLAWMPFKPGWTVGTGQLNNWFDYGSPPQRFVAMFIDHNIPYYSQAIREKRISVGIDMYGLTENTDGTGRYFDNHEWTASWIIRNQIFGRYDGISNAPSPLIAGIDAINYASIEAAKLVAVDRLAGGYISGTLLGRNGGQQTGLSILGELSSNGDFEQGPDRLGRWMAAREDITALPLLNFNDFTDLALFTCSLDSAKNVNQFFYLYDYLYIPQYSQVPEQGEGEPPSAGWGSGLKTIEDTGAQTAVRSIKPFTLEMFTTHDQPTADSVALHRFNRFLGDPKDGRKTFVAEGTWPMLGRVLPGPVTVRLELGDTISITDQQGYGPEGFIDVRGRILSYRVRAFAGRITYTGSVLPDVFLQLDFPMFGMGPSMMSFVPQPPSMPPPMPENNLNIT